MTASAPRSTPEEIERFVAEARAAAPRVPIGRYKVRTFGAGKEMSDTIVGLILAGEKTGTFALESEFDTDPAAAPHMGDVYVVLDSDGRPALVYRVSEVERVPFSGINVVHVQVEGPNARDVAVWRRIHWEYWGAMLKARGRLPSMHMGVIFHRFQVLYPKLGPLTADDTPRAGG